MTKYKLVYDDDLSNADKGDTIILGNINCGDCTSGQRCTVIDIDWSSEENQDPVLFIKIMNNIGGTGWVDTEEEADDVTLFRNVKICPL